MKLSVKREDDAGARRNSFLVRGKASSCPVFRPGISRR